MFTTFFVKPIYNALVYIIDILPGHSAGLAVILVTILIRFILFPLAKKSIKTQLEMKLIEPDVQKIREQYKDKNEQGKKILELYREKGVNPFAGFLLVMIQLPILFALYRVFQSGLPTIKPELLYPFVPNPSSEMISMFLFGLDLTQKNIILAIIAVVTQFIQINLALPKSKKPSNGSFQQDLAHSMNVQMRFIFPLIMFPIAYISAVLALYLIVTNMFMTCQEIFVKRKMEQNFKKS
jgi:YidC/Oxa1 family membrane protein insertase